MLMQDLDAFNPETGLHKVSFKKILNQLQRPISEEQKNQYYTKYDEIITLHLGLPL
jgi:hypothetical protein